MESIADRQTRILWIDTAKGIGIILVVLGHFYLDLKFVFWLYSFHMALFFFLSGVTFSGKGNYLSFVKRKAKALLIPYCFFVVVTMLCNGFLAVTHGNTYNVAEILKQYLIQRRYTLLWFIACLFFAEQIMYGISKLRCFIVKNSFWLLAGTVFILIFAVYRITAGIDLPWNIDLSFLAVGFMCFGKFYGSSQSLMNKKTSALLMASLVAVWLLSSWINFRFFGRVDWFYNAFGNPLLFMISAVSGTLVTINLSKLINIEILSKLGENSLIYYGLHRIVIEILIVVYGKIGINLQSNRIEDYLLSVVGVLLTILLLTPVNMFVMKYCPWCMGKKKRLVK